MEQHTSSREILDDSYYAFKGVIHPKNEISLKFIHV